LKPHYDSPKNFALKKWSKSDKYNYQVSDSDIVNEEKDNFKSSFGAEALSHGK
jgi:hypothetical protein